MTKGQSRPTAFEVLVTELTDYFDRVPLETLEMFGVRTGTPRFSYLRAFRVVASTLEKNGLLRRYGDRIVSNSYGSAISDIDAYFVLRKLSD